MSQQGCCLLLDIAIGLTLAFKECLVLLHDVGQIELLDPFACSTRELFHSVSLSIQLENGIRDARRIILTQLAIHAGCDDLVRPCRTPRREDRQTAGHRLEKHVGHRNRLVAIENYRNRRASHRLDQPRTMQGGLQD